MKVTEHFGGKFKALFTRRILYLLSKMRKFIF